MILNARVPTRIDFAGGYTDLLPFTSRNNGAVVNTAINLYTYIQLRIDESDDNKVIDVHAVDLNTHVRIQDINNTKYNGRLDIVKAALHRIPVSGGLDLQIHSDAPPGAGLGSSGAIGVGLIAVLNKQKGDGLTQYEIADIANSVERETGVCCGKQDHYASALGGINYMKFSGAEVKVFKFNLSLDIQYELKNRLCLCYTGKSRFAKDILQRVVDAYFSGDKNTIGAISNLRYIAFEMREALASGNLKSFGKLLDRNWQNQRRLHASISNPQIESLFEVAYSSGAIGGKACGAGGGGCLVFFCEPDKIYSVKRNLEKAGAQIIDFDFDFNGLQAYISEELPYLPAKPRT